MNNELVKTLIDQAKNKKPLSISYKGRLSEQEIVLLNDNGCSVHCPSVYMGGTAEYSIRSEKEL